MSWLSDALKSALHTAKEEAEKVLPAVENALSRSLLQAVLSAITVLFQHATAGSEPHTPQPADAGEAPQPAPIDQPAVTLEDVLNNTNATL